MILPVSERPSQEVLWSAGAKPSLRLSLCAFNTRMHSDAPSPNLHATDPSRTRYYHREGCSKRLIAQSLQLSRATVRSYLLRAEALGLNWPLPDGLTDDILESLLFPESRFAAKRQADWEAVDLLMSQKHVTLQLVWDEYHATSPGGYSCTCALYRSWRQSQDVALRLEHMLELFDDRHRTRSTVVTSQLPVAHWHQAIDNPTLADPTLDRLIHNAHGIELAGESMRKCLSELQSRVHQIDHPTRKRTPVAL